MSLQDLLGDDGAQAVASAIQEVAEADQAVKRIIAREGRSYEELVEQGETTGHFCQSLYAADETALDLVWVIMSHALPALAAMIRAQLPELHPDLADYLCDRDTWPEEFDDLLDDFASTIFSQPSDEDE